MYNVTHTASFDRYTGRRWLIQRLPSSKTHLGGNASSPLTRKCLVTMSSCWLLTRTAYQ